MNAFELAQKELTRRHKEKLQVELEAKAREAYFVERKKELEKELEDSLESFHGQCGITREYNRLFKNNKVIAELTVEFTGVTLEQDENWFLKWIVYDSWNCGESHCKGYSVESFAYQMVQYLG